MRLSNRLGLSRVVPWNLSAYFRSKTYLNSSDSSLFDMKMFFHIANGKMVLISLFFSLYDNW